MEAMGWGEGSAIIRRAGEQALHDLSEDLQPVGGDGTRRPASSRTCGRPCSAPPPPGAVRLCPAGPERARFVVTPLQLPRVPHQKARPPLPRERSPPSDLLELLRDIEHISRWRLGVIAAAVPPIVWFDGEKTSSGPLQRGVDSALHKSYERGGCKAAGGGAGHGNAALGPGDRPRPIPHTVRHRAGEAIMGTILIIVLVLLFVGALPTWSHSSKWGYFPSGGVGLILLILLVLVFTGRL
jgi:hypothetical protein